MVTADRGISIPRSTGTAINDPMPAFMRASLQSRQYAPCGIVWLGSSTTQGTNASQTYNRFVNKLLGMMQGAYPNGITSDETTAAVLSASPARFTQNGVHGYNGGIGGATSANYLTSALVTQITALQPAVRFHMATTNDLRNNVAPATTQANLQAWLTSLKSSQTAPAIDILVQSYAPWDATYTYTPQAYTQAMQNIAADPQNNGTVFFLDISSAYIPIGIPPSTQYGTDLLGLIDTDHIHQLDKGHNYMAEVFRHQLGIPAEQTRIVTLPLGGTARTGEVPVESLVFTRSS